MVVKGQSGFWEDPHVECSPTAALGLRKENWRKKAESCLEPRPRLRGQNTEVWSPVSSVHVRQAPDRSFREMFSQKLAVDLFSGWRVGGGGSGQEVAGRQHGK